MNRRGAFNVFYGFRPERDSFLMPGSTDCRLASHPHVTMVDVPMMDISSTYIREQIRQGHDVRYLLTEPVWQYLTEMHFYEK